MHIAIIGINGRVGSRVAAELVRRGHAVTGISRKIEGLAPQPGITLRQADATQPEDLAPMLSGHDAVVSASRFLSSNASALIEAVKRAGAPRLLVVGGAGSLEAASGGLLLETPEFPEKSKPEASAGLAFLKTLRASRAIDWTFLSPSALFAPEGPRTGQFRLGGDRLLTTADGRSWISMDDYAIALVDEIETPKHSRQRFTVGY